LPSPLWSSHTPSSSRDLDLTPPPKSRYHRGGARGGRE
jgi:hypothetical protein